MTEQESYLTHYGMPRRSGRYPWGSGDNPYQNSKNFLSYVDDLRKQGLSDTEIARGLGVTTTQLRMDNTIARNEVRSADQARAVQLKDKGYSNVAIGQRMGYGESHVRNLLKQANEGRVNILKNTADQMKNQIDSGDFLDVGEGTQLHIGVSKQTKDTAVAMLQDQGYKVHYIKVKQLGTGHETTVKVLAPPDKTYRDVVTNQENVKILNQHSEDRGRTFGRKLREPQNLSSERIAVRYAEDGGDQADGTMYIRPGVEDLSLGSSQYAQVRIAVDDTHYLKGVAIPKEGLPDGVDIVFNTNKSNTGNKLDAMKPMKTMLTEDGRTVIDKDNPFGSAITRQEGAMNIVNEEGDWEDWSRNLSSQMLSKQSIALAKQQLDGAYQTRRAELDRIQSLTNPSVKKRLLQSFADNADASASHLKAAALPRQVNRVLLPVEGMKDTEIYSPAHNNGETVALVRHPHGGIFEIPELKVNNRNPEARAMLGNAKDAVGINANVAQRLSGADFDGDTVLVIPNDSGAVRSSPTLTGLKDFDPQRSYPGYEGMKKLKSGPYEQRLMGEVSNLITDMTIKGANDSEIAAAVRHSMVVIDAAKHGLNYRQSEIDNNIKGLKKKYQLDPETGSTGASTIVSRSRSEVRVPDRIVRRASEGGPINEDGSVAYTPTGEGYVDKNGNFIPRRVSSTKMAETSDARTLSSGMPVEEAYASHSNRMKSLANEARRDVQQTKPLPRSKSAAQTYAEEVKTLRSDLNTALMNAPLERQAQILANQSLEAKKRGNPEMTKEEERKVKGLALEEARHRVGAKKERVEITDKQWEAIQNGAVSPSMLDQLLNNTDLDRVKELATPRENYGLTPAMESRARAMLSAGYTQAEIAGALGISTSTVAGLQ